MIGLHFRNPRGLEGVLVTIPLNPNYEQGKGLYNDAVPQAVVRNNRIMAEPAVERDVLLIDLYPAMRDPGVYSDAAHVKLPGMIQKAQIVFKAILPRVKALME